MGAIVVPPSILFARSSSDLRNYVGYLGLGSFVSLVGYTLGRGIYHSHRAQSLKPTYEKDKKEYEEYVQYVKNYNSFLKVIRPKRAAQLISVSDRKGLKPNRSFDVSVRTAHA